MPRRLTSFEAVEPPSGSSVLVPDLGAVGTGVYKER